MHFLGDMVEKNSLEKFSLTWRTKVRFSGTFILLKEFCITVWKPQMKILKTSPGLPGTPQFLAQTTLGLTLNDFPTLLKVKVKRDAVYFILKIYLVYFLCLSVLPAWM